MCFEPNSTDSNREYLGPCVPDHHAGAVQFLEQHARIIKLPGGGWRVWLGSAGIRVYGTTRWRALDEAANRVRGRPIDTLLPLKPSRRAPARSPDRAGPHAELRLQ